MSKGCLIDKGMQCLLPAPLAGALVILATLKGLPSLAKIDVCALLLVRSLLRIGVHTSPIPAYLALGYFAPLTSVKWKD